jgi:hypothetical protein
MLNLMEPTGSSAATLAVSRKGTLLYSRGYGWTDKRKTSRTQPRTLIGIASCDKPLTAALIRLLSRRGLVDLNESFFAALKIRPRGVIVDERVKQITITHLLVHKAGWGPSPDVKALSAARVRGRTPPLPTEELLGYVMAQQLEYAPGEHYDYCNYGFAWLRFLAEKRTKKPFDECFRGLLFEPKRHEEVLATNNLTVGGGQKRKPPRKKLSIVWNARDGGPTCASAPYLCEFMAHYWMTGEPRNEGNPLWVMHGSLPGSTAIMIWRPDGTDVVALFNGRRKATHEQIQKKLEAALDKIVQNAKR